MTNENHHSESQGNLAIQEQVMTKKIHYDDEGLAILQALEEGIPYQTLAASLLHKYLSGQLVHLR
jgi:predicted DNA binding CopG/RHH family protein